MGFRDSLKKKKVSTTDGKESLEYLLLFNP